MSACLCQRHEWSGARTRWAETWCKDSLGHEGLMHRLVFFSFFFFFFFFSFFFFSFFLSLALLSVSERRTRCPLGACAWISNRSFTQRVISTEVVYLQCRLVVTGLYHVKLLPFLHMFCVHSTTMHQFTVLFEAIYVGCMCHSCNLPPALLADWPRSFMCYCADWHGCKWNVGFNVYRYHTRVLGTEVHGDGTYTEIRLGTEGWPWRRKFSRRSYREFRLRVHRPWLSYPHPLYFVLIVWIIPLSPINTIRITIINANESVCEIKRGWSWNLTEAPLLITLLHNSIPVRHR